VNPGRPRREQTDNPREGERPETWRALVVIVLVVLILLIGYAGAVHYFVGDEAKRGLFGDMFGGANALFSGLAFAGLIYTILLQRRELALQREELRLTRQEITKQAEQMATQTTTFNTQQFDSTFFHLLHLQASILASLELRTAEGQISGRRVFANVTEQLSGLMPELKIEELAHTQRTVARAYHVVDRSTGGILGHYFRNLYHVVKFVDDATAITQGDKKRYTSFVRAQLSEDETITLFFNCQTRPGLKFKPLVEKYALFEHLPRVRVERPDPNDAEVAAYGYQMILSGSELRLYDAGAYGDDPYLLRRRDEG
jgi:hypothetical protein